MSPSFHLVQSATAVGPWTPGTATVTFRSPVAYGNIVVAFFAAYRGTYTPWAYPSSVTDGLGNTYVLYSQSYGQAINNDQCSFLYVAQNVTGGSCTVTFSGWTPGGGGGIGDGPSLIIAEFEVPDLYQVWTAGISLGSLGSGQYLDLCIDPGFTYSTHDCTAVFRALANNGSVGGADCSDTGEVGLLMLPIGDNEARCNSALVAVAFVNQFLDVFIVGGNYNYGGPPQAPYWSTSGSGVIVATTLQPAGGSPTSASGCLAYQDFPYLGGPPQLSCDNPPNGTIGVAYGPGGLGHGMVASGGTAPYTYALVGGILPPGLTLNTSTGVISGTPTFAGKFLFTIEVTDSLGGTAVANCSIAICPPAGTSSGNVFY
jgi:hypothetical protein